MDSNACVYYHGLGDDICRWHVRCVFRFKGNTAQCFQMALFFWRYVFLEFVMCHQTSFKIIAESEFYPSGTAGLNERLY